MPAGELRDRIAFQRLQAEADGGGGTLDPEWVDLINCRGAFFPERSRERLEAGRLESAVAGTLKVRSSATTRGVTAADRALINGTVYAIRAITNPDRRNRYLEMTVERGTAT